MNATLRWIVAAAIVATAVVIASRIAGQTPAPPAPTPPRVAETQAVAPPAPPTRHPAETATPEEPAAVPGFVVHVVDRETKKPVVGATVELFADGHSRSATTDADGAAHLPGPVPVDPDRLRIRAPGRQTEDFAASDKVLSGDEALAMEFHPGATVEGVVLESDGRPIAGAHVEAITLHAEGIDEFPQPGVPPLCETTTAADGAFRLDGLPANFKSVLLFRAPLHVKRRIVWTQDNSSRMEVRLQAAGRIRGVVRDPSGAVVANAFVGAVPSDSKEDLTEPWQAEFAAKTDADGRYEVDGLPLDRGWTLTASMFEGFANSAAVPCSTLVAASPDAVVDLALRPVARIAVLVLDPSGAPVTNAKVRCVRGDDSQSDDVDDAGRCEFEFTRSGVYRLTADAPGVGTGGAGAESVPGQTTSVTIRLVRGASLVGVVVDDLGAPIAGATIEVFADEFRRQATSDANGAYRFDGLPAGKFSVSANAADHEQVSVEDVDTTPAAPLQITLRRNGRVSLRLRTPEGGPRQGKCDFSWHRVGDAYRVGASQVDWAGDGSTVAVPPGKWDVVVELYDYVTVRRTVEIAPGETTAFGEIALDPGVTLTGRVVDAKGRGIPEARVECCLRYEGTDETGAFKIGHVVAGPQSVKVESDDFLPSTVAHTVAADATPFVVTLTRGGRLRGVVHDVGAKPVDDVDVIVSRDGATVASPDLDKRGEFDARLAAGRYRVVVKRADTTLATKDVELVDGADTPVDIAIAR
jgi:protocatechuate 3,4-dioxygenase beta subunit